MAIVTNSRLILWDIDGTLIINRAGSTGSILRRAIAKTYGIRESDLAFGDHYSGTSDTYILTDCARVYGMPESEIEAGVLRFPSVYTEMMETAKDEIRQLYTVLPGAREALEAFAERSIAQTLLTGNMDFAAKAKMDAFDLAGYLDMEIGAYGSDARMRNDLGPIALRKVQSLRGWTPQPPDVTVIGDAPGDIRCARAAGFRIIAVSSGTFTADQLAEHDPDVLLPDLSDVDRVMQAVDSLSLSVKS